MKTSRTIVFILIYFLALSCVYSQAINPEIQFSEHPGTHNVHLCSDGKFFYTVNGGKAFEGKISQFDKNGILIGEFPVELDMRSIMYNPGDKHFYVNCYDRNIYRIDDLNMGNYSLKFEGLYENDQAGLALDTKGEKLYYMDEGTLRVYDFSTGDLLDSYFNIPCGPNSFDGGAVVAVGKKHIYTWNAVDKEIYVFDKEMLHQKTVKLTYGDYGFSLSYTKKYIFVSTDGNYDVGRWYGYKIK